jgi:hypothetical protein
MRMEQTVQWGVILFQKEVEVSRFRPDGEKESPYLSYGVNTNNMGTIQEGPADCLAPQTLCKLISHPELLKSSSNNPRPTPRGLLHMF